MFCSYRFSIKNIDLSHADDEIITTELWTTKTLDGRPNYWTSSLGQHILIKSFNFAMLLCIIMSIILYVLLKCHLITLGIVLRKTNSFMCNRLIPEKIDTLRKPTFVCQSESVSVSHVTQYFVYLRALWHDFVPIKLLLNICHLNLLLETYSHCFSNSGQ